MYWPKAFLALAAIVASVRSVAQTENSTITVRVFNRSEVAPATVSLGERVAGELLGRAGVVIVWLNCPAQTQDCAQPVGPASLILTMLKQGTAMAGKDTLGLALEDDTRAGAYCYVFENQLKDVSRHTDISPWRLLGYAMAHELGHLLKGSLSHSSSGVMSARWSRGELQQIARGGLEFTSEDAYLMRSRLSSLNPILRADRETERQRLAVKNWPARHHLGLPKVLPPLGVKLSPASLGAAQD